MNRPLSPYLTILRPETLIAPVVGILCAALIALSRSAAVAGAGGRFPIFGNILLGCLAAALLNAASNTFNQLWDIEEDRINKPHRVMVLGLIPWWNALGYSLLLYGLSLIIAYRIQPAPGVRHAFWCIVPTVLATVFYSVKPIRLKTRGWYANFTIALTRGGLLFVAGWSCVAPANRLEPWLLGLIFLLFLLGATTSKDFADLPGDSATGVRTLPVQYGHRKAARVITPFFVAPWFLLPIGTLFRLDGRPLITAQPRLIFGLAVLLAIYGYWIARLIYRTENSTAETNHPSWRHMYQMMALAYIGLAVCYAF
ncbi:MAG: UbiA family prenyltransferase [Myxococcales bacterium]|nr:UbiA family prenyltransferase [Myxococcales bacterium]